MSIPRMHRLLAASTAIAALVGFQALTVASPSTAAGANVTYTSSQADSMKYGYSTPAAGGISTAAAVTRQVNTYGGGVIRRYYNRFPASWSTINSQSHGLPLIISFKMAPKDVNAGTYDSRLTAWFKAAPARKTWWSYMPEPEDDIQRGQYSAAAFRTAYARIAGLARKANNSQLISTLTLMAYTAGSCGNGSTRNIMDYWPGSSNVDQIAFDCTNLGIKAGRYTPPSDMLGDARDAAAKLGKPWGLGEIESQKLSGDDGSGRAAWLVATAKFVAANGGRFACYFDESLGVDYRLTDTKSRAGWRSVVVDQTP